MFINFSANQETPTVTAQDTVAEWRLNPTGTYESLTGNSHAANTSPWGFHVPAGGINGFVSMYAVTITNPNPTKLQILQVNGKDPWPPPPIPPALFANCSDFATRYAQFLLALNASPAVSTHRPSLIIVEP